MKTELERVTALLNVSKAMVGADCERLQAQIGFATALCERHPEQAGAWRPLLEQAVAAVVAAVGQSRPADLARQVEEILAPLSPVAKSYDVYCVGHAHIDMNWMWSWPETVAVTNDTFSTVLRLMDEFPTFHFSQSQASVYRIVEEHHPELLERIAARVREGRWEVTASHWVEGDKNLAGGESLCRHLLYTRRYLQKLFGLTPEDVPIDWSPDTFGHAATVPTYLARGGVKYLYLHRPGAQGAARPRAFWWRGPDGSRVLVKNDMECGYNGVINPAVANLLLNFVRETSLPFALLVYGVGDHGGGPTRQDLRRGLEMDAWPIFPRLRFATAKEYFTRLEQSGDKLPTLDGELNFEFAGCYTTQSLIKKANRFAEARLVDAELAAVAATAAAALPYPTAALETAWRDTLFSHFHDILPGSGVHDTRTYTHGLFQKTMASTSMIETLALRTLAAHIDTSAFADADAPAPAHWPVGRQPSGHGGGVGHGAADGALSAAEQSAGDGPRPFILFNPTATPCQTVIEATIWENARNWGGQPFHHPAFTVLTPDGQRRPAQIVEAGSYWGHDFTRLAFPASLPAYGYAACAILTEKTADVAATVRQLGRAHHCGYSSREREPEGLENEFVRVELDTCHGGIRRLVDRRTGRELISATSPAPLLEYAVERPHGMTAWLIDHTGPAERPVVNSLKRQAKGPYKASLEVGLRLHDSDFTLTYELRAGDPNLYLHLIGTWFERGTPQTGIPVLRLTLPLALDQAKATYEIPFGALTRDTVAGEEVPALNWAMVNGVADDGQTAGCLLLNDSKHGHSLDGSTLRLTLIRSSYDPDPLPEIGRHEIHLAVRPLAGSLTAAEAIAAGQAFTHAIRTVGTDLHAGQLPASGQLFDLSPTTVQVSGIKQAEDGNGIIVRLFQAEMAATLATIIPNPAIFGCPTQATEVDLLERPLPDSTATLDKGLVQVTVPAGGIASVRLVGKSR